MTIQFNCPYCNKEFKVKEEMAGRKATCSGCKKAITVPLAASSSGVLKGGASAAAAGKPAPADPVAKAAPPPARDLPPTVKVPKAPAPPLAKGAELAGAKPAPPSPAPAVAEAARIVKIPTPPAKGPEAPAGKEPAAPSVAQAPAAPTKSAEPPADKELPGTVKVPRVSVPPSKPAEPAAKEPVTPAAKESASPAAQELPATVKVPKVSGPSPARIPELIAKVAPPAEGKELPGTVKVPRVPAAPPAKEPETAARAQAAPAPKETPAPAKLPETTPVKEPPTTRAAPAVEMPAGSAPVKETEPLPAKAAAAPLAKDRDSVEFTCPQCDEVVHVSRNLAGKQTPCPACRRIVKVPLLVQSGPKDWSKLESPDPATPAAPIRPTVPTAWAAAQAQAQAQAAKPLGRPTPTREESEADDASPPLTRRQKMMRAGAATVVAGLLVVGCWSLLQYLDANRRQKAVEQAVKLAEAEGYPPEAAAEVYRAAGEFYLRNDQPEQALRALEKARNWTAVIRPCSERDALYIDVALTQVHLGGDDLQVKNEKRLKWDLVETELQRTLVLLNAPEARSEAQREVGRQLILKGQGTMAIALLRRLEGGDQVPELLAMMGLEMLPVDRKTAEELADRSFQLYVPPPPPPAPQPEPPDEPPPPANGDGQAPAALPAGMSNEGQVEKRLPLPSSLVSLMLALNKSDKIRQLQPTKDALEGDAGAYALGYADGQARLGKMDVARQAVKNLAATDRLKALVTLAATAQANQAGDKADLESAFRLVGKDAKANQAFSSWQLLRLVQLANRAGLADRASTLAAAIPDLQLRGRAQLDVLRTKLASTPGKAEESWAEEVDKQSPAHALAWEAIARHNTHYLGSRATLKAVESWQPETLRPLGYVGVALETK